MYPWRRVLIPTDFSTASQWAFDDAIRMAGSTGAELIILHVRMTRTSQPSELRFPADGLLYDYAEQHELAALRERAQRRNASVPIRLLARQAPDPGAEIRRTAAEEGVDLLVIPTHARHHVAHLLIGSTTLSMIRDAPAPVLAVRYGVKKRTELRRIVVPLHLGQKSTPSLELAAAIAKRNRAEIHLLTICCAELERTSSAAYLDHLKAQHLAGLATRVAVIEGNNIDREIVRYSESVDSDMVCINAPAGQKEISSVTQELIRRLTTPVMLVPRTGEP